MAGSILGTRVLRREDRVLVTGGGAYADDLRPAGRLVARFVRSSLAHARIVGVDTSAAAAIPGVVAVHTAATLGLGTVASRFPLDPHFDRPALARDVVRFQGEPIAVVVAESAAAAADGVAAVDVELDPLPVVIDAEAHLASGRAVLFPDRGSDVMVARPPSVDGLHDDDDIVVQARLLNTRMAVVPLECHAILAEPSAGGGLTLYVSTQGAHATRDGMAKSLGLDPADVRVVAPWVGGGFGAKGGWQVEHVVAAHLARALGRPVAWKEERSENLVSMHAREQLQYARLGLRDDGTITSLEVVIVANAGGYPGLGGLLPGATRLMAQGTYRIPKIQVGYATVATNKAPLGAFRGAGRPQATFLLERLVDLAARRLDIDPVALRRRNLLAAEEFPLTTATGAKYDCGDYLRALDTAVEVAGYNALRAEQAQRRERGDRHQLGIGVACYVEVTAGAGSTEFASVEVQPNGRVTLRVGTASHGQGHETTFAMIVADRLGVSIDEVDFVQSDTALVDHGGGTGGSRSA
ncbi:MAG: xanthine dehydrogenase family protein molybdopterin-binding subunit, partial [Acidimicrobiales bacterium]|nr:xanthine dehydrogenase family protein molybdopterin-binding subunit [Acidimicrobiales bacterium]